MVYVNENTKIYHENPNPKCRDHNSDQPWKLVSMDEQIAIKKGYVKCKNCFVKTYF